MSSSAIWNSPHTGLRDESSLKGCRKLAGGKRSARHPRITIIKLFLPEGAALEQRAPPAEKRAATHDQRPATHDQPAETHDQAVETHDQAAETHDQAVETHDQTAETQKH
jgi:hypothetical protein